MPDKDSPSHNCQAVVLHCIDFRFSKTLSAYFNKRFPRGYDEISLAGSCKGLLNDEEHKTALLEQFEISHRLHDPEIIVLVQHEDCGAYGGSKNFLDTTAEQKFHREEFQKAEKLLSDNFSKMDIEGYYAKLSQEITTL